MQPSNRPPTPAEAREAVIEDIRANVAFENIALALIAGAGFCGAASFILQLGAAIFAGGVSFGGLMLIAVNAAVLSFLFFVVGFGAGAVIITPLFRALEKAKRRTLSPYAAAALAVAATSLIAAGVLPWGGGPSALAIAAVLAATAVTAAVFGARMVPVWRAAEKEEAAAAFAISPGRLQ